ncbi:MAG: carboxypeptidase regulatory-like domain-containing protein [Elusimicrobiota bacterium]
MKNAEQTQNKTHRTDTEQRIWNSDYKKHQLKLGRITFYLLPFTFYLSTFLPFYLSTCLYADVINTVAGTGVSGFSGDGGAATSAQVAMPRGINMDTSGNIYIADTGNHCIRKVNTSGIISTVVNTSTQAGFSGDGGAATSAQLNFPSDVAVDSSGNLYIADSSNHRIRKVNTSGIITTVAGTGTAGYSGDGGAATDAKLNQPMGVTIKGSDLYIADTNNNRIRKVDSSGIITTVAGTGVSGSSGDGGAATSAQISEVRSVTFDNAGNYYIVELTSSCVRKVNTSGIISTVAGTPGSSGFSGDNGAATSAQLWNPRDIAVDSSGNLYIADGSNHRIRRVNTSGIITTVAGTGTAGYSGDGGDPRAANLNAPHGIAFDSSYNLYYVGHCEYTVRKIVYTGTIQGNLVYTGSQTGTYIVNVSTDINFSVQNTTKPATTSYTSSGLLGANTHYVQGFLDTNGNSKVENFEPRRAYPAIQQPDTDPATASMKQNYVEIGSTVSNINLNFIDYGALAGEITKTSAQTGNIVVYVATNTWPSPGNRYSRTGAGESELVLAAPGNYTLYVPTAPGNYSVIAFIDGDSDLYRDTGEDYAQSLATMTVTALTTSYINLNIAPETLAQPSNFYATSVAVSSIQWQFTDNADNETGMYVSSGINTTMRLSENLGPLAGTGGTTKWWETGLSINTQYTRYAEAYNAGGSTWSVSASTYTLANPPSGSSIVSVSSFSISISWSNNSNPGYTRWGILRSSDNFGTSTTLKAFVDNYTSTSYTDSAGLNPATTYWYKVNAFNEDVYATTYDTTVSTITLPPPLPAQPSNFYATSVAVSSIQWQFTDNADNETGMYVSSGINTTMRLSENLGPLAGTGGTTKWWETGLSINTQYTRYAEAYNAGGSTWSVSASTYTLANPPSGSSIVSVSSFSISISWSNNSNPGYTRWGILRSSDNFGTSTTLKAFVDNYTSTSYTDSAGLNPATTYWYKVNAFNEDGLATGYDTTITTVTLPAPQPPLAPSNLHPTLVGSTSIQWQFTDNADNETGLYVSSGTNTAMRISPNLANGTYTGTTSWVETTLSPNVQYTRYAEAYNASGSTWSVSASTYTLANPPSGSSIVSVSSFSISISWSNNSNPGYTRWGILRSSDNFGTSTTLKAFVDNYTSTSYTDSLGINPNATYWYKVNAFNENGLATGYDTTITTVTLPAPQPPLAPSNLHPTLVGSTSIQWQFTDNADNETGLYVSSGTNTAMRISPNLANGTYTGTTSWVETTLSPNVQYTRYAEAYNASGSTWSVSASTYTLANPPSGSSIVSVSSFSISISWSNNSNPNYTRWGILRSSDSFLSSITIKGYADNYTNTNYTDTDGLTASTSYWYKVQGWNQNGIATDFDTTVSTQTLSPEAVPPPAQPTYPTTALIGTTSIQWQFTDNANNETGLYVSSGTSIVYRLSSNLGPLAGTGGTTSWWELSLAVNTPYTRYAEANNATGSNWSDSSTKYTAAKPPSGSGIVSVSSVSVSISWSANSNPNYTRWGILRSADNFASSTTLKSFSDNYTSTSYTDSAGLNPATTYWYKVNAFNEDGIASVYDLAMTTITLFVPVAPSGMNGTALSPTSIEWSWVDNASNEDVYRVKSDTNGVMASLSANTNSWPETNLSVNTLYNRYVEAFNTIGASSSTTVGKYTLANSPVTLIFKSVGTSSVELQWDVNDNPIWTRFGIAQSTTSDFTGPTVSTPVVFANNLTSNVKTVSDLEAATTYYFRVWAYNGDQIESAPIQSSTRTVVPPLVRPSNLYPTLVGSTSIQWQFTDNADNETGLYISTGTYTTMRISENLGPLTATGGTTKWWEQGLSINTAYTRYAEAYNADGSIWSVSISSYTAAMPPSLTAVLNVSQNSITLNWSNNSNPTGTEYQASRSTASNFGNEVFSNWTTNTGILIGSLPSDTTYYLRVRARNGDGIITQYDTPVSTKTEPGPPNGTADNLTGTVISTSSIQWAWTDTATNETGYRVKRSPDGTNISGDKPKDTVSWLQTGLSCNVIAYVYVEAFNAYGTSTSVIASKYTLANPPSGSGIVSVSSFSISISWSNNSNPTGTKWGILRSVDNFASSTTLKAFSDNYTTTSYLASDLLPLTSYWFKVCAYNEEGIATTDISVATITLSPPQPPAPTTGWLAGKVTKSDGITGIGQAVVEAIQSGIVKSSATTSTNGTYQFINLSTGTYDVRATATGYISQTKTGYTVSAGATTTVNFVLQEQTGTITGKVTKSDGVTGITQAIVEALQSGIVKSSATTSTNGTYQLINLSTGTYDVRATATGYISQTKTGYTVSAGVTTTVNFELQETASVGIISGKVTKTDGTTTLPNALVEAFQSGTITGVAKYSSALVKSTTTTDTAGNYSLVLTPGVYDIRVSLTGYQSQTKMGCEASAGKTTTLDFALYATIDEKPQKEYKTTLGQNLFIPSKGGTCKVGFSVPVSGKVTIKIYDILGRYITTLVDDEFNAGNYQKDWDGTDEGKEIVPPGVYILHYEYPGGKKETRKIGVKR